MCVFIFNFKFISQNSSKKTYPILKCKQKYYIKSKLVIEYENRKQVSVITVVIIVQNFKLKIFNCICLQARTHKP